MLLKLIFILKIQLYTDLCCDLADLYPPFCIVLVKLPDFSCRLYSDFVEFCYASVKLCPFSTLLTLVLFLSSFTST
jgi:hypothetical protein